MIIDKKGRIFGRLSIVDLTIVLLVIIAISVMGLKYSGTLKVKLGVQSNISYKIEVKGIRSFTLDGLGKGEKLYDGNGVYVGKIAEVVPRAADGEIRKSDGTTALAIKPDRFDAMITVEAVGTVSEKGVMIDGVRSIHKGGSLFISSKNAMCESMVRDIKTSEQK